MLSLLKSVLISFNLTVILLFFSALPTEDDIIDEALDLFRANCFFRNFEIQGNADRVLIYLILFISDCLGRLSKNPPQKEALKILNSRALDHFSIPGDPTFPLNALYSAPATKSDAGLIS